MKRLLVAVSILAVAVLSYMGTGCVTTGSSTDTNTAISSTAGTIAAAAWLAHDNPTLAQEASVVAVMDVVKGSLGSVVSNQSYSAVLYPMVQNYVATSGKVQAKDVPLVLAGSAALLSGVDLLVQSHPSWQKGTASTTVYVTAFINGAEMILRLPANAPEVLAAKDMAAKRAAAFKK